MVSSLRSQQVDLKTRRRKQQKLMAQMVERKVRSRAQQLYEDRGQAERHALEDWVQAEEEVLGSSILGPLYHRLKTEDQNNEQTASTSDVPNQDSSASEPAA
jgi:hypothetical protein